jgi:hypothetical protein
VFIVDATERYRQRKRQEMTAGKPFSFVKSTREVLIKVAFSTQKLENFSSI